MTAPLTPEQLAEGQNPLNGPFWVVERAICVVCPQCAFTFDGSHTDTDGLGYSCPVCNEAALAADNARLTGEVEVLRGERGRLLRCVREHAEMDCPDCEDALTEVSARLAAQTEGGGDA